MQEPSDQLDDAFVSPTVPLDDNGFVLSFRAADQQDEARAFMDKFGFVCLSHVLTEVEADATLEEFWASNASLGLERGDPSTWEDFWKTQRFGHLGIIGMYGDVRSIRQLENRQNEHVHEAFACVLGTGQLVVDCDRLGIMRPTCGVLFPVRKGDDDGQEGEWLPRDKPAWETLSDWLHMDCNPHGHKDGATGFASIGSFRDDKSPIDFRRTLIPQGILTLTDARAEDGGFHCVPGSHRLSWEWSRQERNRHCRTRDNIQLTKASHPELFGKIQNIPVRKGCLLAWSPLLMHGNHPNRSSEFRAVQYIRMVPHTGTPYGALFEPQDTFFKEEVPDFQITPLGEKLFGLRAW